MHYLSHILRVGYFSIFIRFLNGYMLFAANLEDFHSIAKKLVPENFADSLVRMTSKQKAIEDSYDYEDSNENEGSHEYTDDITPHLKGGHENRKNKEKFILSQNTQVDFDELVERVKKRLAMELKQKNIKLEDDEKKFTQETQQKGQKTFGNDRNEASIKRDIHRPTQKSTTKVSMEEMSPFQDEPDYRETIFNKSQSKQIQSPKEKDEQYEYADAMKEETTKASVKLISKYIVQKNEPETYASLSLEDKKTERFETTTENGNERVYKKIDMTQKDSYEDYIIPAKETDIYASSENNFHKYVSKNKRYKVQKRPSHQKRFDSQITSNPTIKRPKTTRSYKPSKKTEYVKEVREDQSDNMKSNHYEIVIDSEEIKAKTANLWFDANDKADVDAIILTETSERPKYGTRLPTRQTYKIVTPDYYAKLPIVAEKYNFDEPIPEKDREREIIKYIGNPPASINKKVRLM